MENEKTFEDPVIPKKLAFEVAKNPARVASILKLSRATVSEWGDTVPPLHAYRLIQIFPQLDNRSK